MATRTVRALRTSLLASLCLYAGSAASQAHAGATAPSRSAKAANRDLCVSAVEFCVSVPVSWKRVGDIFDNLGFVAAEPRPGADPSGWPQLTVVAFEPPEQTNESASPAPSESSPTPLDVLVDRMLMPNGALASAQTLARSRTMLNGAPAEIVRVQFIDKSGHATAIEEVALIEGEDNLIYSVALRCSPQDFSRLEPVFQRAVQSWRLRQVAAKPSRPASQAPAGGANKQSKTTPGAPKQDSTRP